MAKLVNISLAGVLIFAGLCHCSSGRDSFDGASPTGFGDGGGPDASPEAGQPCAAISLGTDHRPLDLYIMMDTSGSMTGVPWQQAKLALSAFFENPGAATVAATINYFPAQGTGLANDCVEDYYKLFPVALGPLPSFAPELEASLARVSPTGGTPLVSAIDGALFAAVAQKKAQPDHAVVAIIVTDGEPTDCGTDLGPTITNVRAALVEEGVPTFTIGIGGDASLVLDPIAAAGGSGHSLSVDDPTGLADKIREAQAVAVGCEFVIPKTSSSGQTVDPKLVNVTFGAGSNAPHVVHGVPSSDSCGTAEGWYYDDPKNPKTVRLCPSSCTLLNATSDPKIDVNFGCATEVR